jgi:hypothetical protein
LAQTGVLFIRGLKSLCSGQAKYSRLITDI